MINIKSLNKKVDQLRAEMKVKGDITSYEQVEAEGENMPLLDYMSSFIGDSFISRLEPITSPITSNEAVKMILDKLTKEELYYILGEEKELNI